jgi:very-short-patch-repair endonuclease
MNLANFFMTIGFTFLGIMALLEITLAHEKVPEWRRNCLFVEPHSAAVTPQAIRLSEALTDRGISNKQEYYDGHKCVDIYIPGASLNLEIDGRHHLTDPDQLLSDLYRDYYSFRDGKVTIHIPNFYVDTDLDALANSIAVVARKRQG